MVDGGTCERGNFCYISSHEYAGTYQWPFVRHRRLTAPLRHASVSVGECNWGETGTEKTPA